MYCFVKSFYGQSNKFFCLMSCDDTISSVVLSIPVSCCFAEDFLACNLRCILRFHLRGTEIQLPRVNFQQRYHCFYNNIFLVVLNQIILVVKDLIQIFFRFSLLLVRTLNAIQTLKSAK